MSCEDKDEFIEYLLYALKKLGINEIDLYPVEDIELNMYFKAEGEKK